MTDEKRYENPTTVRFDKREKKLLNSLTKHLSKRLGVSKLSHADVLRIALNDLAKKEGIEVESSEE